MAKKEWTIIAILGTTVMVIFCLLVGLLVGILLAKGNSGITIPQIGGCNDSNYFKQVSKTLNQWFDISERARSTSRITLTSVVGEMQQMKRDFTNLPHPDCAARLHQLVIDSMSAEIDTYLLFMQQASDVSVTEKQKQAADKMTEALAELKRLSGTTYLPSPTRVPPTAALYVVEYYISSPGGVSITYNNENGDTEQIETTQGEWKKSFTARSGAFLYISGQTKGYAVGCIIGVDGKVLKESTSQGKYTIATCSGRLP